MLTLIVTEEWCVPTDSRRVLSSACVVWSVVTGRIKREIVDGFRKPLGDHGLDRTDISHLHPASISGVRDAPCMCCPTDQRFSVRPLARLITYSVTLFHNATRHEWETKEDNVNFKGKVH